MATYYPRFVLNLSVPLMGSKGEKAAQEDSGSAVNWTLPVRRFRWEKNDHTQADVLEVEVDWGSAGLDPRMLSDAVGTFFLGNAGDPYAWSTDQSVPDTWGSIQASGPANPALRFVGIMVRPARKASEGEMSVTLLFHDYTALFLAEKPFVAAGVPSYSQRLSEAWARICDHVGVTRPDGSIQSVVAALRDRIRFVGAAEDVVLSKAVAARFAGDRIASEITDAWAVWQQCVGMCGLISYIRGDECLVTTATDYYTERHAPRLIWGKNVTEIEEERDVRRSNEGIVLTSFDPMTGTTIEALWPPLGDTRVRKKHLGAKQAQKPDAVLKAETRTVFSYPGVSDAGALTDIAKRVYEERSRQELAGRVVTSEMFVEAGDPESALKATGEPLFDLLDLGAGEIVRIEFEQEALRALLDAGPTTGGGTGEEARINLLVGMGYDPGAAKLLVRNLATYAALGCKFFTRSVIVSGDAMAMSFETEIHYVNRIQPTGDANADDA